MNLKDLHNFKNSLKAVISAFEAQEKFLISPLAVRLEKAASDNPGDQTINLMASFLQKKAEREVFISRSELQDVYNKFYTSSSRCVDYIEKELGKTAEIPEAKKMTRDHNEGSLVKDMYAKVDQGLVNALSSALDKNVAYKPYSSELVSRAVSACLHEISGFGIKPVDVKVVEGNEDCLLCQATYETPKGKAHALIPVEIKAGRVLFPTVFVTPSGFENLNEDSLGSYLVRSAGKQLTANVAAIFEVIKTAKYGVAQDPISDVERIVIKANAQKETPISHDPNAILYQQLDAVSPNVETNADSEEVETFAQKLSSNRGLAEITFGTKAVASGRNLLVKSMKSFGYSNPQVSIVDVSKDAVCYAVAVPGGPGIRVPVKFANGLPIEPTVALADGQVSTFDEEGVDSLLSTADYNTSALVSRLHGSKPSELLETIKTAMNEGDLLKAEEALNVLAHSNDKKAFEYGFGLYQEALSGEKEAQAEPSKCSMQVKTANSQHILCGHTNLPLHKVYQDAHGDCLPLYRKNIDHTGEGGSFLNSRIYFG